MARPIDEKIVAMKLENSDFTRKVKDTLKSFDIMNKGLSDVGEIDMGKLEQSLGKMESRISASGVIIGTAISKLTSSFIDKGVNLWSNMMDPIIEGGKKRALNIEQAKFQFQGLGMDVEETMASANAAVKGTAFGLDEAAVVAGQFGATGIRAGEQMTAYLRGISGVAAMTGSSYADVGNIFTTVAGNGRLMGAELLRLSARGVNAAAILSKELGVTEGEVRGMVTDGEISFDMFAQAMNNAFGEHATRANETYVGSLSNVKAALGRIGAAVATPDFENKRNIFNALTPKIDELAVTLGPLIEVWNKFSKMKADNLVELINKISFKKFTEMGGATNLAEAFNNVMMIGVVIMDGFKSAFSGLTGSSGGFSKVLVKMTSGLRIFTELLLKGATGVSKLFVILKIVVDALQALWKLSVKAGKAIANVFPKSSGTSSFLDTLSVLTVSFNKSIDSGNILTRTIDGIGEVLKYVGDIFTNFGNVVDEVFSILGKGEFKGVGPWEESSKIIKALFKVREAFIATFDFINSLSLDPVIDGIVKSFNWVIDSLKWVVNAFKNLWNNIKENAPSGNTVAAGGFIGGLLTVFGFLLKMSWDLVQSFKGWGDIGGSIRGVLGGFKSVLGEVEGALKSFSMEIKSKALLNIALAVGVLAASLWVISRLNGAQISWSLGAVVGSLGALIGAMALMTKYDITGTGNGALIQLMGFAMALNMLAFAITKFSKIDLKGLAKGVGAIVVLLGALVGTMFLMSKFELADTGTQAMKQILIFSIAINIIAIAVKKLGKLSLADVAKGVGAVVVMLGAMTGAMILLTRFSGPDLAIAAGQFIGIAASIYLLSFAVSKLAKLKASKLWSSVGAISVILGALAIFMKMIDKTTFDPTKALGVVAISSSIWIMATAIQKIAKIDNSKLTKGLLVIGGVLVAIGVFARTTVDTNLHMTAAGLLIISVSLMALAVPIGMLGKMKLSTLAKGISAIAVTLVAVGLASKLLTGLSLAGSGLIVLAVALNLLVIPILALSQVPFNKLVAGMSGLAIGLALVGGAAALLGLAAVPLLAGAGALAVLGAAVALAGVGVALFGTGLASLAVMTGTAVTTIVAYLGTLILGFMTLVPKAVEFIWFIIISMAEAFRDNAHVLAAALYSGMIQLMDTMTEYIPQFAASASLMILAFVKAFEEHFPILVEAGTLMMIIFIETLAENIDKHRDRFLDAFNRLFAEILILFTVAGAKVIEILFGWVPGVGEAMRAVITTAEDVIKKEFGIVDEVDIKLAEFNRHIEANSPEAKKAAEIMGLSAEQGAAIADFQKVGGNQGLAYVTSFEVYHSKSNTSGTKLANEGKKGAESISMSGSGGSFATGFAGGISSKTSMNTVSAAGRALANMAKRSVEKFLDINSPSRVMETDGGWFGEGFARGIANKTKMVGDRARGLARTAVDSLNEFIDGFSIPEEDNEIHFKAVIDYDPRDLEMFGSNKPFSANFDTRTTSGLAEASFKTFRQNENNNSENRTPRVESEDNTREDVRPAIINVVTPEGRDIARWLVDDITDIQEINLDIINNF